MPKTRSVATKTKSKGVDVEAFRQSLVERRQELGVLYQHDVRVGQESNDEGSDDIVDRANNSYNRELMFSLSDGEREMLLQIDRALARIEEGTFGACSHCGEQIGGARLKAVPWARYCIDCQELEEQGMLEG